MKLDFYIRAVKLIESLGVELDAVRGEDIVITIKPTAQHKFVETMADDENRRSDKKK